MTNERFHGTITSRLALYRDEVARLPIRSCGIRVREGVAWVTASGEDRIVHAGQAADFTPGKFPAVVVAIGAAQLIIEVFGCDRPQLTHVAHPPMTANTATMSA